VNKFCFDNDKTLFEPLEEVDGWALIQLYTTQFVPNVRSAFKFNNESKPEKYLDSLYKPGFYWFAFDYSEFTENFGDEGVAVSLFRSLSDKSIYLRNDQNENVSLGVYDVVSEDLVDQITFEVKSQTQAEFLSVVNSIELRINGESFSLAAPDSLSAEGLFVVELNQDMQNALDESKQIEILLNVNSVESNQVVDLSVVFEAGENKSESLDMINVAIFLSDISIVLADNSSDLELIDGLKISDYGYSNVDFDVDGTIELESIKLKLNSAFPIDPENYFAVDFAVDSEVLFTHRFTNDALEATLPQELVNKLLEEGVKTLEMLINVDFFEDQSDMEFVLETKLAEDDQALLVELPQVKFAAAKIFISDGYFTYSDKCELDSNIYYNQADLVLLSEDFKNVYESLFDDFDSIETIGVGLDVTPYLEISDINFNIDLFGSDVVDVPKSSGFTDLFEYNAADFEGVLINFSSNTYQEEFNEGFNSKRLLSLDKLELSTENLKLRFNLFSDAPEDVLIKLEHKCVSKSDYGFSVDELVFDSKIFVSDLSEFVKLNFTNLVFGKNVFVKVNWEQSLLSLIDLTSNPIIEPIVDGNGMLIGFDYEDSEELGSILDQLLEDLGTDDTPMSEQELEDLIESNSISLTVGNANANLITEDFALVYKNQLHTLCADRLSAFETDLNNMKMELVDVDDFINRMFYLEDPYADEGVECENKDIYSNEFSSESENFEFFNLIVKKTDNVENFKLEFELDSEEYDFDADGENDQPANVPVNLTVRMEDLDDNVLATQTCENTADLSSDRLQLNITDDCLIEGALQDEIYFTDIRDAFNNLDNNSVFRLVVELEYAADFVGAAVELGNFERYLVDRPFYIDTSEIAGACGLKLEHTYSDMPYDFHNKKLKLTFHTGGFTPSLITSLPGEGVETTDLDLSEDFSIEFDISKIFTQALLIEMGDLDKDLKLIGMEIDSNSVPLVLWGSFEDADAMAVQVNEIQLCNVVAE